MDFIKLLNEKKIDLTLVDRYIIISLTNKDGVINYVSDAFCKLTGYSKDELLGQKHSILRDSDTPKELYIELWKNLNSAKEWEGEIKNRAKNGEEYWVKAHISPIFDDNKEIEGFIAFKRDITHQKRIEEVSVIDDVTKLYNKKHFNDIFSKEVNRAKRDDKYLGLMVINIDYFKPYYEHYGESAGESVLKDIAKSLKNSTNRASDFVFRLDFEEFGVIFSDLNAKQSFAFANKIIKNIASLQIPHEKNNASKYISVSIGLVLEEGEEGITDKDNLYKFAKEALLKAKHNGRNRVMIYEE